MKAVMYHYSKLEHRARLCHQLYLRAGGEEARDVAEHYYLSLTELRELAAQGRAIGAHSVTHRLLSQLDPDEQAREVQGSLVTLSSCSGATDDELLLSMGPRSQFQPRGACCSLPPRLISFSVEARDIDSGDLRQPPDPAPVRL